MLSVIIEQFYLRGLLTCSTKVEHLPFIKNNRCTTPFQLIHCDIRGPSSSVDTNEFKWFLVCDDDHNRLYWLFVLKHKIEVITSYKIYATVKRQFEVDIMGFRTYNAINYCNHELNEFLNKERIRHETSCPYTSQENGLAKRKIRDIMNKS